ncbi:MAG: sensor domain-containing diguanylate cyclase, partial [Planctomycetota bacterium]
MVAEDLSSGSGNRRILLIGDIKKAFSDAETIRRLPCEIQANLPDAVDIAAGGNFAVIGVVMTGSSTRLSSALKALRQANSNARIILLAQIYQEPLAMQVVGSTSNGATLADDYLICPIQVNRFYEFIELGPRGREASVATAFVVDAAREAKVQQLEKLATEDDLTGLKNRRYTWEFSRQIIERARKRNERVTLLLFDIDNFKHYNDVYGHSAGDEILKQAAVLMQRCCRQHDVVGRIGGDEFAVIFWDDPHIKTLKEEAERRS